MIGANGIVGGVNRKEKGIKRALVGPGVPHPP